MTEITLLIYSTIVCVTFIVIVVLTWLSDEFKTSAKILIVTLCIISGLLYGSVISEYVVLRNNYNLHFTEIVKHYDKR